MYSIRTFPEAAAGRRGFTVIELLVALTISGIIVGVLFQLLQGQSRYVRLQGSREEVQQNGRAAIDLIGSELRGIPSGGIIAMSDGSLEFRLPRGWGILCNDVSTAATTAWVRFPTGGFPADFERSVPNWGIAVEQTANPSVNTGAWKFVTSIGNAGTADQCTAVFGPAGANQHVGFSAGVGFMNAGTAFAGTPVLVFERMSYDVDEAAAGASIPGWWIRRAVGWSSGTNSLNMQPMAGPVSGAGGLLFTYFEDDGVTETASAADVGHVELRVISESRAQSERNGQWQADQVDTLTTNVFLRN